MNNFFCYRRCIYLIPKELEQGKDKEPHICTLYNKRVRHLGCHPKIVRCVECKDDCIVKENRNEM